MSTKLDRSKPFAEVFGEGAPYRYEQNGVGFDGEGNKVTTAKTDPTGTAGGTELDGLDLAALQAKATELGLTFHPNTGIVKLRALIQAAPPVTTAKTEPQAQVDAQLEG